MKYLCQKGPKMRFFKCWEKSMAGTFVLHEVAAAYRLKIDQNKFFWKNLGFESKWGPKWTQNEIFQLLTKISAWKFSNSLVEVAAV